MAQDFADRVRTTKFEQDIDFLLHDDPGKLMTIGIDTRNAAGSSKVQITDHFSDLTTTPITSRNSPTALQDMDATRYWIHKPQRESVAVLLDMDDQLETEVGLNGPIEQGVAQAIRRYRARRMFESYYGSTWTGDEGTTAQAFLASNILPADLEVPGTPSGITLGKIRKVAKKVKQLLWPTNGRMPTWIITAEEVEDILEIDQYINSRYNPQTEMALQTGEITPFMGFNFLCYEFTNAAEVGAVATTVGQAVNASGHRRCPVFMPEGLACREWLSFKGMKDVRADLNHGEQTAGYTSIAFGRRYPAKCLIVETA